MRLILDVGSGKSTHNDNLYVRNIVDAIKAVDSGKHEIILKAQLFQSAPPNEPLSHLVFDQLYEYGNFQGYRVTSSVFDKPSLEFLLRYDIPFVKIACRPDLYWLIGEVPRKIEIYASWNGKGTTPKDVTLMTCVPEYPANISDYPEGWPDVSDHTVGWTFLNKSKPITWEKHFVLEREEDNPDAGPFAVTSEELKEIM